MTSRSTRTRADRAHPRIVRRSKGHAQSVINTATSPSPRQKTVEVAGARVHLTGKEYQMLELLSLRKGTTLTKEMFLNHLYGGMDEPEAQDHRRVHLQSFARSWRMPPTARITSRRCGAAASVSARAGRRRTQNSGVSGGTRCSEKTPPRGGVLSVGPSARHREPCHLRCYLASWR